MAKFETLSKPVEAVRFTGMDVLGKPVFDEAAADWLIEAMKLDRREPGSVWFGEGWHPPVLMVFTQNGTLRLTEGDWLVRDERGYLTPVPAAEFAQRFAPVGAR